MFGGSGWFPTCPLHQQGIKSPKRPIQTTNQPEPGPRHSVWHHLLAAPPATPRLHRSSAHRSRVLLDCGPPMGWPKCLFLLRGETQQPFEDAGSGMSWLIWGERTQASGSAVHLKSRACAAFCWSTFFFGCQATTILRTFCVVGVGLVVGFLSGSKKGPTGVPPIWSFGHFVRRSFRAPGVFSGHGFVCLFVCMF